jgi:hypothetical protein
MFTEEIISIMESGKNDFNEIMKICKKIIQVITFQQYLLSDFLDYNKMQNNLFQIQKEMFQIVATVKSVIEIQQTKSDESNT